MNNVMLPLTEVKKLSKFKRMLNNSLLFSDILEDDASLTLTSIDVLTVNFVTRVVKLTYKFCCKSGYKVRVDVLNEHQYKLTFVRY